MRRTLLRAVLAAILLATVVAGFMPAERSDETGRARAAVVQALRAQGLAVQELVPAPRPDVPAPVLFSAPACDRPLQVTTLSLSFQEAPLLEVFVEDGFARRYIYFGHIWRAPSPLAARLEWLRLRVLSMLVPGYDTPPKWVLLAAEPPDCHAIERIDWRPVWRPLAAHPSAAADVAALGSANLAAKSTRP